MSQPKTIGLDADLHAYLLDHGTPPDEVQRALIERTRTDLGDRARMQIAPEQGSFMTLLARLVGARFAVEVGTFTGYSALCIARGLVPGGRLLCCDVDEAWVAIGREHWALAGVDDRIDVRIAPAAETLAALPREPTIDLAFVDADKENYAVYYEELLARLAPNGVILVDNVLWGGAVIDADRDDASTEAIRAFNDLVVADDRVDQVMLPIADGLTLITRRG